MRTYESTRDALIAAVEEYLDHLTDSDRRLDTEEFKQHQFRIVTLACHLREQFYGLMAERRPDR